MKDHYLIRIGEISLKKGNKPFFERLLKENLTRRLAGFSPRTTVRDGRFYLETDHDETGRVEEILSKTAGLVAFSRTLVFPKDWDTVREGAAGVGSAQALKYPGSRFKVAAKRTDKSFIKGSYEIQSELGEILLDRHPDLKVDVHNPDWKLHVEIREKAYVYSDQTRGPGGLPVSTAGRGMLLLSGGIDSPVAGFMMARRGLRLAAVHFHTPPYTSEDSLGKVRRLAALLRDWDACHALFEVPFTELQLKIMKSVPRDKTTLFARAAMMATAELLAKKWGAGCLVTGEALSQVASQTLQSLHFTDSIPKLPVFRPCIGLDKEDIIQTARKLGTFETSIEPFTDCCSLFSPPHPCINPDFNETMAEWEALTEIHEDIRNLSGSVYEGYKKGLKGDSGT
jgi:thiamine biosynthesis protein ThiI